VTYDSPPVTANGADFGESIGGSNRIAKGTFTLDQRGRAVKYTLPINKMQHAARACRLGNHIWAAMRPRRRRGRPVTLISRTATSFRHAQASTYTLTTQQSHHYK